MLIKRSPLSSVAVLLFACSGVGPADGPQLPDLADAGAVDDLTTASGCSRDDQCKGARICVSGVCVDPPDLAEPPDLTMVDAALELDLAPEPDLSPPLDLTTIDHAPPIDMTSLPDLMPLPDLSPAPDLSLPARRIFVHSVPSPAILDHARFTPPNVLCQQAADAAQLGGKYVAVLSYSASDNPRDWIVLHGGSRKIVDPRGSLVATDATFWGPHAAGVTYQADGTQPDCMSGVGNSSAYRPWTGFDESGVATNSSAGNNCNYWTNDTSSGRYSQEGVMGDAASATKWANLGSGFCDPPTTGTCELVYCIEQ